MNKSISARQTAPSCHLWIQQARDAPIAVIFRRGPTHHVQLIKWQTDTDTFQEGQWFKGRINGQTADLSADGKLLIYGALKVKAWTLAHNFGSGHVGELWTAVSRPPYLTALALWAHPGYCRAGGRFDGRRDILLGQSKGSARQTGAALPKFWRVEYNADICRHLEPGRTGWKPGTVMASGPDSYVTSWAWQRVHAKSGFRLLRRERLTHAAATMSEYALADESDIHSIGTADWADILQDGRLAMAREGELFVAELESAKAIAWKRLADFSESRFQPTMTPAWARQWPRG